MTIEREADGRFIASVPEVPGCHVYGCTRRQAVARAHRALQFYVDSLRTQGQKPPRQPLVIVAECPAIPGCVRQGVTGDEAIANIREAIGACLDVRIEQGLSVPV